MSKFNPVGGKQYYLGSSISSTATTILLSSFLEPVTGTPLTMTNMNTDICYGTIQPKTNSTEFISFTGVTQNADGTATLTGVLRGLARKSPFTTDAAYKLPHSGQSIFILSDAPQVFVKYVSLDNDQTVGGVKTFSSSPIVPTGGTGTQAANNQDIANAITGASGTATNLQFGTVKLSVAAVSPATPIAVGDNDTRVPTQGENDALVGNNTDIAVGTGNKLVTQTGLQHASEKYAIDTSASSTAYVITLAPAPTSLTDGMVIYAKIINANTTTTPTLNINAIGAKTIVKGISTALSVGDIGANSYNTFIYNGTNLVLQNPTTASIVIGLPSYSNPITITINQACTSAVTTKIAEWTGLTGDTDDIYQIDFEITGTQDSSNTADGLALYLNNTASSYIFSSSSTGSAASGNVQQLSGTSTSGFGIFNAKTSTNATGSAVSSGSIRIKASKTIAGTIRTVQSNAVNSSLAGSFVGGAYNTATWSDTTNQITSIQLYFQQNSGSSSTVTGKASLYKINR